MDRNFSPEEVRDIGGRACPIIADSYDQLADPVRSATAHQHGVFGDHSAADTWTELFELFRTAVTETPISVNAMGRALVAAADRDEATEQDLAAMLSGIEDAYDDARGDIIAEQEAEAEADRQAALDQWEHAYGPDGSG